MLIHRYFRKRLFRHFYLQSLLIYSIFKANDVNDVIVCIDSIAKLFSLTFAIVDRSYVLISFEKLLSPDATVAGIVKFSKQVSQTKIAPRSNKRLFDN